MALFVLTHVSRFFSCFTEPSKRRGKFFVMVTGISWGYGDWVG